MTDKGKTLLIYLLIWLASVALAAGSTLWFGLDARVPVDMTPEGVVTKSRSFMVFWFMPGMATVLYGSMALAGWLEDVRRRRKPPVELGADARRGLQIYGRTVRNGMIGFGLLILLLQLFALFRTAGVVAPLGLDREGMVRLFNVVAGALFAYIGNATPKLPWVRLPGLDTSPYLRANRLVGWIFTLGGLGYILSALVTPFERMIEVNRYLIAGMIVLPGLVLLYATVAAWRGGRRQGLR